VGPPFNCMAGCLCARGKRPGRGGDCKGQPCIYAAKTTRKGVGKGRVGGDLGGFPRAVDGLQARKLDFLRI
ncbi:MAG: hypothetical protein ACKOGA_09635, partial [Planctomycetaceae bacterium]